MSIIQRDHGSHARRLVEEIEDGLHEIIWLHRAPRYANNGDAGGGFPVPAEIVKQAHRARRVALHGVNAAVSGAGAGGDDREGLRREAINPLIGRNRLTGSRIGAQSRPIAFALDFFVGNRAFHDEHERVELTSFRFIPPAHKAVAAEFKGEDRVMKMHPGEAGNGSQQHILDTGLGGCGDSDGIPIAAQSSGDPDDMNILHARSACHAAPP